MNRERAGAVTVVVLLAVLAGAWQPAPPAPASPAGAEPRVIWVNVVTKTGSNGRPCNWVEPNPVHVGEGDVLVWVNKTADRVTLHFGAGSPFVPNNFQLQPHAIAGGVVRTGTLNSHFTYSITPRECKGTLPGPDVIVDGGMKTP